MAQYIDKSTLVEHLDMLLEKYPKNYYVLCMLDFLDTLEVKEVDLEKEQLEIMDKARKWADARFTLLPEWGKSQAVLDALYCAYLEGAGIRTT